MNVRIAADANIAKHVQKQRVIRDYIYQNVLSKSKSNLMKIFVQNAGLDIESTNPFR